MSIVDIYFYSSQMPLDDGKSGHACENITNVSPTEQRTLQALQRSKVNLLTPLFFQTDLEVSKGC